MISRRPGLTELVLAGKAYIVGAVTWSRFFDLYQRHGTWFDRGEVQRLMEFSHDQGGGPFRAAPGPADPAVALPVATPSPSPSADREAPLSEMLQDLLDRLYS